jgi:glycopeptide antibiotics resistance protein
MERNKKIPYLLFALYCVAMVSLLFGRAEAPAGIPYSQQLIMRLNLIPFRTLRRQLWLLLDGSRPWLIRHAAVNLLGNIILFIPLGIFLPKLWMKSPRLWKVLLVVTGIIAMAETIQVLTLLGRCDIDDLILNLLGTAIGYGLYKRI